MAIVDLPKLLQHRNFIVLVVIVLSTGAALESKFVIKVCFYLSVLLTVLYCSGGL